MRWVRRWKRRDGGDVVSLAIQKIHFNSRVIMTTNNKQVNSYTVRMCDSQSAIVSTVVTRSLDGCSSRLAVNFTFIIVCTSGILLYPYV